MIVSYAITIAVGVCAITNSVAIQIGAFRWVIRKEILVIFYAIAITVGVGIIPNSITVKI